MGITGDKQSTEMDVDDLNAQPPITADDMLECSELLSGDPPVGSNDDSGQDQGSETGTTVVNDVVGLKNEQGGDGQEQGQDSATNDQADGLEQGQDNETDTAVNNEHDIMSGRGKGFRDRPANILLTSRVRQTFSRHEGAGKAGRKAIIEELVDEVLNRGGKFLNVEKGEVKELSTAEAIKSVAGRYTAIRNSESHLSEAKQGLLGRLSGADGDEIARTLSSILDEEAYDNLVALVARLKGKRPKRQGANIHHQGMAMANAKSNEDGPEGRSNASGDNSNKMNTLISGFSSLNLDEKNFDKLDISVDGEKYEDGRKTYIGTTLAGQPHGIGFMIVKEKKIKQAADESEGEMEWPEPPKSGESNRKKIRGQWYYYELKTGLWQVCDSQDDMDYTGKEKGWEKILWGHWRKGILHGFGGSIFFKNNHRCFGPFSMNQLNGNGLYITPAYKYAGNFNNHKKDGYGRKKDDKGVYEGNFRNGKYDPSTPTKKGFGKYTFNNGKEGELKNGKYVMKD